MIRGPRSRAGFRAYPVGPPNDTPRDRIKPPTIMVPSPVGKSYCPKANNPKTKTKVPIVSLIVLETRLRMAGPVEKVANTAPVSSVAS